VLSPDSLSGVIIVIFVIIVITGIIGCFFRAALTPCPRLSSLDHRLLTLPLVGWSSLELPSANFA